MQELFISSIVLFSFFLLNSCNTNSHQNIDLAAKQIWKTVKAHNKAWSVLEDINDQLKYVHDDVVFIKPPFKEILKGKEKYKEDYEKWIQHAKVNYFHEVNPVIKIYGNGNFAIVTYNINMSFIYNDEVVNDWKGADMLTLVKENGKWLITSDMFARESRQAQ